MSRSPGFYLQDITEAGEAILAYTSGYDFERFSKDRKTVDAVVRRFEIIGEAVKGLPQEWTDQEPDVPWHAIAGFRNILAHAYFQVDEEIVWQAIERDLPPLLTACIRLIEKNG